MAPKNTDVPAWAMPKARHPIFGKGKLMDGVLRYVPIGKSRTIYCLDPNFEKTDFRVFGHNGLEVGKSWFGHFDMLRDGAHGALESGISGTAATGCYSIIINGGGGRLVLDHINTIFYCDAGAPKNDDPDDIKETPGYKALAAAMRTKNPVRVIRGPDGPSLERNFKPMRYFRYDGLYQVVGSATKINLEGGLYELFKLERLDGQPEINRSAPSVALCEKFDRVKDGYAMDRPRAPPPAPTGPVPAFYAR